MANRVAVKRAKKTTYAAGAARRRASAGVGLLDGRACNARFQPNFAESGLVLRQVLRQHVGKRLGLLRADIDALEVVDLHVLRRGLVHSAEHKEEIPQIDADLNAVGVALTVVPGIGELDFRL